ncbi:MAG: DUF2461 domain-containing protein [Cytophagales bacterium]|nr:DUF2461 domain-containing protein [Cytophagales bacterium]
MKDTFRFLSDLSQNNNRQWFQANKAIYEQSQQEMLAFSDRVAGELNTHDLIETLGKRNLFRIYRDVRFGKDKTPYKTNWAGYFKRATAERRGGCYYQVGPKGSFVMGGFFGPNAKDLLHIRNQIALDSSALREVIGSRQFKNFFGELQGSQLKTAPRGFDKQHADIDLLRYKQFILQHDFIEKEVFSQNFPRIMSDAFKEMRPFFDCMSEMLTTDLNGEELL